MSPSPDMDTRPYTEFINVADGNDWGQESAITKVHEAAFLDVSDERLKDASGLFFHFTDKIYVRKDYQELYTYLCDEFDKGNMGVIVSGSPGIGKSFFNLYALARRLAQKKTTILRTGPGFCFIFDEQGPSGIPDPSKLGHNKLRLPVSRRQDFIWVLYDSHQKSAEPLSAFTTRSSFLVQTTSPDAGNFFHWYKQGSPFVGIWYMNVWGFEELRAGSSLELHNRHLKEEDYYYFYGPCIRDHLIGRKHFITACKQAVTSINNVQKFAHAFEAVTSLESASNSRVPHRIFILRVLEDGEERREKPALDFKSAYTLEQIREKFAQVKNFESEILFSACQGVSQTGILRDWVFENLAIEYTSGNMKSFRKKVGPLYDMIQVPMC
ncbi:hypothetical protein VKT23_008453 [Stygiomarasmius scandens]|uniref:Uncharacterized protein n=1 Tax=Marasmiellus scandens TaxID=2682957 RepID=A0ABR1JJS4_9AGAR